MAKKDTIVSKEEKFAGVSKTSVKVARGNLTKAVAALNAAAVALAKVNPWKTDELAKLHASVAGKVIAFDKYVEAAEKFNGKADERSAKEKKKQAAKLAKIKKLKEALAKLEAE